MAGEIRPSVVMVMTNPRLGSKPSAKVYFTHQDEHLTMHGLYW